MFTPVFNRTFSPTFDRRNASGNVLLIYDQFTDADTTLVSAHTIGPTNVPSTSWTYKAYHAVPGTAQIDTNKVRPTTAGKVELYTCDPGYANGLIELDFNFGVTGDEVGIDFRFTDASNHWFAEAVYSGGLLRIIERTSGTSTTRATTTLGAGAVPRSTDHHLALTLNGDAISLVISGGATGTVTYSSSVRNTVTNHGFIIYEGANVNTRLDNFKFTTL